MTALAPTDRLVTRPRMRVAAVSMIAAMLAVVDPGDEVVVFEPLYEIYTPDAALAGAVTRSVTLHPPDPSVPGADWTFDPDDLAAAFNDRTRAILINTPNNPTGKVFTRDELAAIAALCVRWNVVAIMDEIYDQIAYIIAQGWSPLVEHVHPSNSMATYWSYWKLPFFGEKDLSVIVSELEACHRAYPDHHVRLVGYDEEDDRSEETVEGAA